jgi:hypothetical protein
MLVRMLRYIELGVMLPIAAFLIGLFSLPHLVWHVIANYWRLLILLAIFLGLLTHEAKASAPAQHPSLLPFVKDFEAILGREVQCKTRWGELAGRKIRRGKVKEGRRIAAITYYDMAEIHFDEKLVPQLDEPTRRWLVFHEYSHCELGLHHIPGQVIMQRNAPEGISYIPYEVMDHEMAHILMKTGKVIDSEAIKKRWQLSHYVRQRKRIGGLTP